MTLENEVSTGEGAGQVAGQPVEQLVESKGIESEVIARGLTIEELDKIRVERLMEYFKKETEHADGNTCIYPSLFLIHHAIARGLIKSKIKCYNELFEGKIPFYVETGRVLSREYYFACNRLGYRTQRSLFPKEAFDVLKAVGFKEDTSCSPLEGLD